MTKNIQYHFDINLPYYIPKKEMRGRQVLVSISSYGNDNGNKVRYYALENILMFSSMLNKSDAINKLMENVKKLETESIEQIHLGWDVPDEYVTISGK